MEATGRVGFGQKYAAGTLTEVALGQFGQMGTGDVSAKFQEAVLRGNCFYATDTTVRLLDAADTAPVGMTVANPTGSKKNLVLWGAFGSHNGTALTAGGDIYLGVFASMTAVTTGTAVTIRNCLVGAAGASSAVASVAATVPTAVVAAFSLGTVSTGAATVSLTVPPLGGWINGGLILAPGGYAAFHSTVTLTGAGGGIINNRLVWEEIPE